jgi:hypothetical protein
MGKRHRSVSTRISKIPNSGQQQAAAGGRGFGGAPTKAQAAPAPVMAVDAESGILTDAVKRFASPHRQPPRHMPEGPKTATGYIDRVTRRASATPAAKRPRMKLDQKMVDAIMARIPEDAASPKTVVKALEAVIMAKASAEMKIEAMIAVSARLGESISGPFSFDKEMADELLLRNDENRTIGASGLEKQTGDMREGRWVENGSGVTISKCGLMNDGQHRNHSISRTDTVQRMNLTVGVERESRRTVDIGKTRSAGDHLKQQGFSNSSMHASIGRAIIAYEYGNGSTMGRPSDISTTEINDRVVQDPELQASVNWAKQNQAALAALTTMTIGGLMHYLLRRIDEQDCLSYLNGIMTGAENGRGLPVTDPRWIVREMLLEDGGRRMGPKYNPDRAEILMRGWNAHRGIICGRDVKVQGKFPGITSAKVVDRT